ncbi:methionyl-tRNA formyltransferase [Salinibacter sp.]|uniref:methionyl-tRNA formyltransferase n=1 Tax=Salinibacter sp. TaxID=2065818 RepID=UPI0021E8CCA0|nr:methionyl-tRNA formyltransferase [Salinibacter sp.]
MLSIGLFGDGRWAQKSFKRISDVPNLKIEFLVARYGDPDFVLKEYAEEAGVPFFHPKNVNSDSFIKKITSYDADVNVSIAYDQIIHENMISIPQKGFLNCHAGALPFYRGRNVLNWALINGEDRFGVTVHFIDENIDTGDIITQRFGVITPEDDYESILDKAVTLCASTLLDALHDIDSGEVSKTAQEDIHPVGFYCSGRAEGDEWIDWSWPTNRVYDFVRALSPPGPGARTILEGRSIVILDAEKISEAPEYIDRPGTVVGKDRDGIEVKTGDTVIKVTKIADWEGEVCNQRTPKLSIGTLLGVNITDRVIKMSRKLSRIEERLDETDCK